MLKSHILWLAAALLAVAGLPAQTFPERPVSEIKYFHNWEQIVAAGTDGRDFLVVGHRPGEDRSDERDVDRPPPRLYAHRVTENGQVLDGTGIRIPMLELDDRPLVLGVFWSGDAYTVLYAAVTRIYVSRIDRDGLVVEPPHLVTSDRLVFNGASAASNGERILVATGSRNLLVLDMRGRLLRRSTVASPIASGEVFEMSLGSNGNGFLLAWLSSYLSAPRTIGFETLSAAGDSSGTFESRSADWQDYRLVIASDGDDYLVVHGNSSTRVNTALHVSSAGHVLNQHLLEQRPDNSYVGTKALVWNGATYLLLENGEMIHFDRSGAPLRRTLTADSLPFAFAVSNGRRMLAGTVRSAGHQFISATWAYVSILGLGGEKIDGPLELGITAGNQSTPVIAVAGGKNFLVAWQDNRAIRARRFALDGSPIDQEEIALSADKAQLPKVIFDGEAYVVAWTTRQDSWSSRNIVVVRVTTEGVVSAPLMFAEPCPSGPDLATDGESTFVVWVGCNQRIRGVRVHRSGFAEPPISITPEDGSLFMSPPRVAWNGKLYLVAWNDFRSPYWGPETDHVRAIRVSQSMTVLDPQPIVLAGKAGGLRNARVASNGRDFMVAWTEGRAADAMIKGGIVDGAGAAGEVSALFGTVSVLSNLIWDGGRWAMAVIRWNFWEGDLVLVYPGEKSGKDPLIISATPEPVGFAALGVVGSSVIAVYGREAPEPAYGGVFRVFVTGLGPMRRHRAAR